MKPILFNTDMVRAILEGRKTVTRRVVKPQPEKAPIPIPDEEYWLVCFTGNENCSSIKPPYRPGDILYVREAWTAWSRTYGTIPRILYKADRCTDAEKIKWRPSIYMPRKAARIFMRVTEVRVERLQDMSEADAIAEGFEPVVCDHPCGCPCTDCMDTGYLEPAILGFVETWNSTIKPADRALYGWEANPWVWVIVFERINREEVN